MAAACSAVDHGRSGWCTNSRHDQCAHRPGGPQEGGVWLPECYLQFPPGKRWKGADVLPDNLGRGSAVGAIIRPSHRWRCSCDCHQTELAGQLDLFAEAS